MESRGRVDDAELSLSSIGKRQSCAAGAGARRAVAAMPNSTRGSGKEAGARCGPDKAAAGFLRASPAVERVAAGHHGVTPATPARPFGPLPVQALERLETGCHLA